MIGPRDPISIPTSVFFVSLFLFLPGNLLSYFFFYFSFLFQRSVCIVEACLVHWPWIVPNSILRGRVEPPSPPIPSSSLSRFSAQRFLDDALTQPLDKRYLLHRPSIIFMVHLDDREMLSRYRRRPSCWALTPASTTRPRRLQHDNQRIITIPPSGMQKGTSDPFHSITFTFSCVKFASINPASVPCRRRF